MVIAATKHLEQLAELKQTVTEQDVFISSVTEKLNMTIMELDNQKISNEKQAQKHAEEMAR